MTLNAGFSETERSSVITTGTIFGRQFRQYGMAGGLASAAWPTANTAILIPFALAGPTTIAEMFWLTGTTPGTANYDLGIYDENFKRITNLGTTASVNTTNTILPAGGGALAAPVVLPRGRYYMAMVAAATTITVMSVALTNQVGRMMGLQIMAGANVPLPATITPASYGTNTVIPMVGMATITNIL